MSGLGLRPVTEADVSAVADLERECFAADPWSAGTVRASCARTSTTALVAHVGGRLAGWVCVASVADVADLERVAVHPAHRRTGVATALLDAALAGLAPEVERVLLEVRADDDGALALYAACGFTPIAVRTGYYRDGTDAFVLQRERLAGWAP